MIRSITCLVWDVILFLFCVCGLVYNILNPDWVCACLASISIVLDGVLIVFHAKDFVKAYRKHKAKKVDIDH